MKRLLACFTVIISMLIFTTGCSDNFIEDILHSVGIGEKIEYTSYAEDVGFELTSPKSGLIETETIVEIEGTMDKVDALDWSHIWVEVTAIEPESNVTEVFDYYIPVEDGSFQDEIKLHQGVGEYDILVMVPSDDSLEEDTYYDVASFSAVNTDGELVSDIEYSTFGKMEQIEIVSPEVGMGEEEGKVYLEGTVPEGHEGNVVVVQIEKDFEEEQIILPIKDETFSADIPLYFGEGLHTIRVQTFGGLEDIYYEAATIHLTNKSNIAYAPMMKYPDYVGEGLSINEPAWNIEETQDETEYRIAGEIDPSFPRADDIDYIIVTMIHEEEEEAGYIIPVIDYEFDGAAYFRFGPGEYSVVISIPDFEQEDKSMFYYEGVMLVNHQVTDIEDERGLLPSKGIESDHEEIIQQAKKITKGLKSEREKAKAIYKFVSQHVAYDVNKAENDIFDIGDSAVTALETGEGICQDYAFLATALLRASDIEARYVNGDAGERHAWVEAKVDGDWIEMDPTWGAGYVYNGTFHFDYTEDYFDPDPDFLAETHTRDEVMY